MPVPLWPCPYQSVGPDACVDLRRRGHRRLDRLFPQLSRRQGDRDRRHWPRLRRLGEVGRVSGARLVRRLAAGAVGSPETTAQVHPGQFTAALMRAAEAQGAELRLGRVTGITQYEGRATGVEVDGNVVEGDAMVIAMGPWSILAAWWLPLPAVFGLKGHSLVFDTGAKIPAEAAFLEYQERSGAVLTPELFPRTDGTTYVCAISSEEPLPVDPARVTPDPGAIARLEAMCSSMSPVLASAKILARQACYRPVTRDGLPLIGPVPGVAGAYIATGHSVWGILNAPATGEAMAQLIVEDRKSTRL